MRMMRCAASLVVLLAVAAAPVAAQQIISPVGGTINSGGPGSGTLAETYNHAGLLTGFTSGVTDFETYLAANPLHSLIFPGNEWFSNAGTTSASVTYDLGSLKTVSKMALWNEESSGIGTLDLWGSTDGNAFFSIALGLRPTDNPLADYPADVYGLGTQNLRYVRMDMSDCPQRDPGSYPSCAIGEVAFKQGPSGAVPEPVSMTLLATGLLGLGGVARRRRNRA